MITADVLSNIEGNVYRCSLYYTKDAHMCIHIHGTYIRLQLRNRCVRKEQSLLFDLFKSFD